MNHLNLFYGGANASRSNKKRTVIQPFTAHMLRHTYATLLYDAGVDIKTAQRYLGHANVELTLSIYTHLTQYKEDKAMDAFNKMIEEKKRYFILLWASTYKQRYSQSVFKCCVGFACIDSLRIDEVKHDFCTYSFNYFHNNLVYSDGHSAS